MFFIANATRCSPVFALFIGMMLNFGLVGPSQVDGFESINVSPLAALADLPAPFEQLSVSRTEWSSEQGCPRQFVTVPRVEMFAAQNTHDQVRRSVAAAIGIRLEVAPEFDSCILSWRKRRNCYEFDPPFVAPEYIEVPTREVRGEPVIQSLHAGKGLYELELAGIRTCVAGSIFV
jgi:hypothetical protein